MDERQRREYADFRALTSEEAAAQLMSRCADGHCDHKALLLLRCRTWKRKVQDRLARHLLFRRPYVERLDLFDHFASFMSLQLLVNLMREHKFVDALDLYQVRHVLEPKLVQRAKLESEISAICDMLAESRFGKSQSIDVRGSASAT
jgi:hypothetical protein